MVQVQDESAEFDEFDNNKVSRVPVEHVHAHAPRRMDYRIVLNNGSEVQLRDATCEYDPVIGHLVFQLGDPETGTVYRFYWPHVAFYVARVRR